MPPESTEPEHYEVCVERVVPGRPASKSTTSGTARSTAAWLRALADEIDPKRPVMRGGRTADF